jgi:phosphatidylinositol-bisphosphatase
MVLKKNFRLLRKPEPLDQEEESRQDFTVVLESRLLKEALFFQSTSILSLYPNEVELYCKDYVEVAEAYGCLGVLCMNQEDAVLKYLALVTGCFNVAKLGDVEIYRLTQVSFIGLTRDSRLIHVADVSKLLSSGHFYFSVPGDTEFFSLTCSAQQHITDPVSDFTWNRSLLRCLTDFGVCVDSWCFKIICGSVEIKTVYVGANQVKSVLLSRVSCERAGTRFNVRGVDDEGHVANFVETEQLVYHDNAYTSFVQVRGTLPVFWNQSSAGGRGNVTLSRGFECSQRAFEKFASLVAVSQQWFQPLFFSVGIVLV